MPTVVPDSRADATPTRDEFLALVCADQEWLRAQFDAIIAAEWPSPPPVQPGRGDAAKPPPGPAAPRRPASRPPNPSRHPGAGGWARQPSPPATVTGGRKGGDSHAWIPLHEVTLCPARTLPLPADAHRAATPTRRTPERTGQHSPPRIVVPAASGAGTTTTPAACPRSSPTNGPTSRSRTPSAGCPRSGAARPQRLTRSAHLADRSPRVRARAHLVGAPGRPRGRRPAHERRVYRSGRTCSPWGMTRSPEVGRMGPLTPMPWDH